MNNRVAWVDVGKGVSILGVVLFHVLYLGGVKETHFNSVSSLLDGVRMSLFFLLSGMFSHKIALMSSSELFRKKVWAWGAPYILWCIPAYIVFGITDNRTANVSLLHYIIFPENGMWFLYALTIYAIVAYVSRSAPPLFVVWASIAVSAFGALALPFGDNWGIMRVFMFAPFFFAGLHAKEFLLGLTQERHNWKWWATAVAVAVSFSYFASEARSAIFTTFMPLDSPDYNPRIEAWRLTMALNIDYVGSLGLAVMGAIGLSLIPYARDFFIFFGQRTLAIYLSNELFISWWYSWLESRYADTLLIMWLRSHVDVRTTIIFAIAVSCGLVLHYVTTRWEYGHFIIPQPLKPFSWEKRATVS